MVGAPEVYQLCANLIQLTGGKRVLDVGTFTGCSALAWALAIPEDGQVITMDISDKDFKSVGEQIIADAGVRDKIKFVVQPALKTLDELLANDEAGKFDFAFIDADKRSYPLYYEKCLALLRPGGIIAIDNALLFNSVLMDEEQKKNIPAATEIGNLHKQIHGDSGVNCCLLPIDDGLMLVFKK